MAEGFPDDQTRNFSCVRVRGHDEIVEYLAMTLEGILLALVGQDQPDRADNVAF
ncbi:hypothetical protein LP420_18955 [Massilia sp. B-10]|nr:hypothetical protein LP420_18955 [Massilia sp. B-10]